MKSDPKKNEHIFFLFLALLIPACATNNLAVHEAVTKDLNVLAARAQKYFRTSGYLGGGGNSYTGLTHIGKLTKFPANNNGSFRIVGASAIEVILEGTGFEPSEEEPFQIIMRVDPEKARAHSDRMISTRNTVNAGITRNTVFVNSTAVDEAWYVNCNGVLNDLLYLAGLAQQYYARPAKLLGGGHSFKGATYAKMLVQKAVTSQGTYTIDARTDSSVTLVGVGRERNTNGTALRLTMVVLKDNKVLVPDSANLVIAYDGPARNNDEWFYEDVVRANHDAVLNDLVNAAARAQQYFRRPTTLGGGGNSFNEIRGIEMLISNPANQNGTYTLISGEDNFVVIEGRGVEKLAGGSPMILQIQVSAGENSMNIIKDTLAGIY